MPFQDDKFGHRAYNYLPDPAKEKLVERSPDKLRSSSDAWYEDRGAALVHFMEVKGWGVLTFNCRSNEDGRIRFDGVALVTKDEIQFD